MNVVAKTIVSSKNFVRRHRTALAVTATVTTTVIVMNNKHQAVFTDMREFIAEHDMLDAYNTWTTEKKF